MRIDRPDGVVGGCFEQLALRSSLPFVALRTFVSHRRGESVTAPDSVFADGHGAATPNHKKRARLGVRASTRLRRGPYPDQVIGRQIDAGALSIDQAFRLFMRARDFSDKDQQLRRYQQTHRKAVAYFGPARLASTITTADRRGTLDTANNESWHGLPIHL